MSEINIYVASLAIVLLIFAFWLVRLSRKVVQIEHRMVGVEASLSHLPVKDDLRALERQIEVISRDNAITGERVRAAASTLERIDTFLLAGAK